MIRLRRLRALPPRALDGWRVLARESATSNLFADPRWVVTSAALVDADPLIAWVGDDTSPRLVLPLSDAPPRRAMPVQHQQAFWTENSYQSSLLCREVPTPELLHALRSTIVAGTATTAGALSMSAQPLDAQSDALDASWGRAIVSRTWTRAAIDLTRDISDPLESVSKNKRKKARRALSRLEEQAPVSFESVRGDSGVDCFLRLEHGGWKGQHGTSIRAFGRREVWFRSLVRAFGDDAVFTLLRCGSDTVATSVNFVSGSTAFGFKIGWDAAYAECSPGVLHEWFYVRNARDTFPSVRFIDSVSDEQSFIEPWWPDTRAFRTATYAFTPAARAAHAVGSTLDRLLSQGSA